MKIDGVSFEDISGDVIHYEQITRKEIIIEINNSGDEVCFTIEDLEKQIEIVKELKNKQLKEEN